MKTNQKVNLAILLTFLTIGIAVGVHFDIVTNETILETGTTLAAVLGIYYGLMKDKESKEVKRDFEKKAGITHREFKMIKNR